MFKSTTIDNGNQKYQFTGSSDSATKDSPLDIKIQISRISAEKIKLKGTFKITGFKAIAGDLKNLKCILLGSVFSSKDNYNTSPTLIGELLYKDLATDQRQINISRDDTSEYSFLQINISGVACTMSTETAELKIEFKDINLGDIPNDLLFTVKKQQAEVKIDDFHADYPVVQGNTHNNVKLSWQITGKNYTYTLYEGLTELTKGESETDYTIENILIGDHTYTLAVTHNNVTITKNINVRALSKSTCANVTVADSSDIIANFCIANDRSKVFSLILNEANQINSIWYSREGFDSYWKPTTLSDKDKAKLQPFAFSFMIHLKDVGQDLGKVLFIGGSHVKTMECSNFVAIVDLDADSDSGPKVNLVSCPWPSRMGHYCVLFPHADEDKIWLLGGLDEYGAPLKDIWVSGNGEDWDNIAGDGSVNVNNAPPIPWAPRCLLSAAVNLDEVGAKKELWIGGGFSESGGSETNDIWIWDKPNWKMVCCDDQETPLSFTLNNTNSYLSSAIAFIGKIATDSSGLFAFGGFISDDNKVEKEFFNEIKIKGDCYALAEMGNGNDSLQGLETPTGNNTQIISYFFKGCLWYMVFTDEGDEGITISFLFYWVPTITSKTIIPFV